MAAGDQQTRPVVVGLLGPLLLRVDGVELSPGGRRTRALLAMLAASEGLPIGADALREAMWGEDGSATVSSGTLHVHVHTLRGKLGSHSAALRSVPGGYALGGADVTSDVAIVDERMSQARAAARAGDHAAESRLLGSALDQWRGDVVADLPDLPLEGLRARATHLHRELVVAHLEATLRAGHDDGLPSRIEEVLVTDPFAERLWALLAIALDRAGRQADALAAVRRARTLLDDELGADPGPLLQSVEQALLHQRCGPHLLTTGDPGTTRGAAIVWRERTGAARARALPADGEIVIGRSDAADVALLDDAMVSRRHAILTVRQGAASIADAGSRNGTRVNGALVTGERPLVDGDIVAVGDTTLLVDVPEFSRQVPTGAGPVTMPAPERALARRPEGPGNDLKAT